MLFYTLILILPFLMLYAPPPPAPTLPLATLPPFPRATLKPLATVKPRPLATVKPPRPLGMPARGWMFDPLTGAERAAPRALETRPGLTQGLPLPRCDRRASALSAVPDSKPTATQAKPQPLPRCPVTGRFLPRKAK